MLPKIYESQIVFTRNVLTHAEYDSGATPRHALEGIDVRYGERRQSPDCTAQGNAHQDGEMEK